MNHGRFRTAGTFGTIIILVAAVSVASSASIANADDEDLFTVDILVKNLTITRDDQYAYVQYALPDEELFLVAYTPLINSSVAHHMLSCACERSGSNASLWVGGVRCRGEQVVVHGWGGNAPPLKLPEDVGFPVGRNTPYKYIVINIHYSVPTISDNVGNRITLTRKSYHAGIMSSGSMKLHLPPKTYTIRTPFSCHYDGPSMAVFAVRVHAHRWARVISLYRVRDGQVSQIAKGNPHWPQAFYSLSAAVPVERGDGFIGECVHDNDDDREIVSGLTHEHEMCRVYVLYSYEPEGTVDHIPPIQECWGDADSNMSRLLPADSVVLPDNLADMYAGQVVPSFANPLDKSESSETTDASKAPIPVISRRLHVVFLVSVAILMSIITNLVICCIYRRRQTRHMQRQNTLPLGMKNNRSESGSIFGRWINRQQGFERLEQRVEDEDQLAPADGNGELV